MPRKPKKTDVIDIESEGKLDSLDKAILNIAKCNPEYTNNQIGNELIKLEKVKAVSTVYDRLSRNIYLNSEISKLRDSIKEDHTRTVFPLARKAMLSALKDKELHAKDKLGYVKLAYDKELSTKEEATQVNTQVNIESLQMMINKAME